ncbi:thiamine phosphate synthase [Melghirimyces algeriensis]|uniref:Thiazole tautomerase (Transcriptional regulator TenI) n=1 Tax=Melghirimyces algeriensis TaxID=910412 RepID=A0A521BS77_9BACL|nr:thiamine phosphate synthase [Melghirimyces algeriensis]SMO49905.1 thiazole tautomerase (transcriptional regulator TenI) [Melghirimyces algeriensis]
MGELHFISRPDQSLSDLVRQCQMIQPFVDWIHLRKKDLSSKMLVQWGKELIEAAGVEPSQLVINSDREVAEVLGCGGIHVPEGDSVPLQLKSRGIRIGCSVHSLQSAIGKEKEGADYLFFGHIFKSKSKPGLTPLGLNALQKVVNGVKIPVVAIGGVSRDQMSLLSKTGCAGVAVISAIADTSDPRDAAKRMREKLSSWREETVQ